MVFSFIEFVLVNSKLSLRIYHIEMMFAMFVLNRVTELESNYFFNLLTKENETAKTKDRRFLLDDKVRNEVF